MAACSEDDGDEEKVAGVEKRHGLKVARMTTGVEQRRRE
jgi:hypothetical protein